jgi:hypothetical protein
MAEECKSWARSAGLYSLFASAVATGCVVLYCVPQLQALKIMLGAAAAALIVAGFILAIIAFAGSLWNVREGSPGLAVTGLCVNGALLLGFAALIPAMVKVPWGRNAGYTLEQMREMPRVIPGSKEILNEAVGFRLEIPGDFFENQQPPRPEVLYSFLRSDGNGVNLRIDINRLGARIAGGSLEPESPAGLCGRIPPDAEIRRAAMSWRTYPLDAFQTQFPVRDGTWCLWGVQVPLAREGIQVMVSGRPESSEESRNLLAQLLTGLQGLSNWDPPSVRIASAMSLWRRPRASSAGEPAPPADPPTDLPTGPPAEPIVAPGHSEIRTFPGVVPRVPGRNEKLIYEFDLSMEPALIHVPASYDGSTPFGLIVFLPGDGPFTSAPRGWAKVLEERKLLLVSPQKGDNSRGSDQRCGLAVVCALKMQELYKIDPQRIYIAGYSGGARMASMLGYYHADLFRGTIQSCGSNFHRAVPAVETVPLERDKRWPYGIFNASPGEIRAARNKVRFVIITGPGDFRHGHLLDIYEGGFLKDGFQATLIDDPWMEHVTCDATALREAIDFIEQGSTH